MIGDGDQIELIDGVTMRALMIRVKSSKPKKSFGDLQMNSCVRRDAQAFDKVNEVTADKAQFIMRLTARSI